MAWYIVLSFILFLITDYIYLYNYFDSRFFLTSSGSKLKSIQSSNKFKFNLSIKEAAILLGVVSLLFLLNFSIVSSTLNSNFLEIQVLIIELGYLKLLNELKTMIHMISLVQFHQRIN